MIIDRLEESGRYRGVHPLFERAFRALGRPDLSTLGAGTHPIEGERLSLIIAAGEGAGTERAVLEAHRRYIDIQFVIEGTDVIGWRPLRECARVAQPYDAQKDVELYADRPLSWSTVGGSLFAVYFPGDAHAPLGGTGALRRAIIKVGI
ncbi:MAG TPA: YhcH/YjgK/YiaL family protein [Bacteroidota bacterium]|nr:YhcH/YjgK/YiaL family protein [Bacteroidota bacterium]